MVTKLRNSIVSILAMGVILLGGCNSTSSVTPTAQKPSQPIVQPSAEQPAASTSQSSSQQNSTLGYGSSSSSNSSEPKIPSTAVNRVDVIYFHLNQRCVTCLCFEEHVNNVIDKYFTDAISSGKLTYKVLNAQLPQNAGIAKKYGAVGSQLFVNTISNGVDHIEDIAQIWNWNCRNNASAFELKVKNMIEASLKGQG